MNQPDHSPPPAADPDKLPKHTTPTWEVELLISGVAVFAMLQLPGWFDDRYFSLLPRFDADWSGMLLLMYLYLKSAAVILAVTFALHLSMRAHWIALVGMHSVYPDGVLWEKKRMGPVQRELERTRYGSAEVAIERADNRATTVFAGGVALATILLFLSALVAFAFFLALVCTALTGVHARSGLLLLACIAVLVAPPVLFKAFDRVYGNRLRPDGATRRSLAAVLGFYDLIGFGRRSGVMALLSSHTPKRSQQLLIFILFFGLINIVVFQRDALKSPQELGNYELFPTTAESGRSISSAYYDDQRDALHNAAVPYMQSAVISGPYLQLMVPYRPSEDTPELRRSCPATLASNDGIARATATLDCLTRIHAVTLDGTPLTALHYDAASDPRTQRPALQAMIDVRALAPGRHELRVMRAPPAPGSRRLEQGTQDVIPFWH